MIMQLQYGELTENDNFINSCNDLTNSLIELQNILQQLLPLKAHYDKMCLPAQIELDLFFAFTLNSLLWINLRVQGVDPNKHPVKDELLRIKAAMNKWEEYQSRDKRPTVDIPAAKRFIQSGLYDRYRSGEPPNKKILFDQDE